MLPHLGPLRGLRGLPLHLPAPLPTLVHQACGDVNPSARSFHDGVLEGWELGGSERRVRKVVLARWAKGKVIGHLRTFCGVRYATPAPSRVRRYVLAVAAKELEPHELAEYRAYLERARWTLRRVSTSRPVNDPGAFRTLRSRAELERRVRVMRAAIIKNSPIAPLILCTPGWIILDGSARIRALKALGIKACLAYVGSVGLSGITGSS